MSRARSAVVILFSLTLTALCSAQSNTTTCTQEDGRQVYIRYNPVSSREKVVYGKPWTPGGAPMTLFTEAPLTLSGTAIPIGAYTVYPIPAKEKWTLVVNKNVSAGAAYDEKQDVARAPMETDQVPDSASTLEVAFAHYGAKCTLRIYFGKTASFADFMVK